MGNPHPGAAGLTRRRLQISVGCNSVYSYCIVPSTRGREVSRPMGELVAEAERLAGWQCGDPREVVELREERLAGLARGSGRSAGVAQLVQRRLVEGPHGQIKVTVIRESRATDYAR